MGQAFKTLASGIDEKKVKEIGPVVEQCYDEYIAAANTKTLTPADFYHAVCQTVEEINKRLGSSQFRVPLTAAIQQAYQKHHRGKGKALTKEEFEEMVKEVIVGGTGITGFGAKDFAFYIYGVPAAAWFVKERIAPKAVPNGVLIPAVTSFTVFLLAKLNKI